MSRIATVKWFEKDAHGLVAISTKRKSVVISIAQKAAKCRNGLSKRCENPETSKLNTRVRFPSPAQPQRGKHFHRGRSTARPAGASFPSHVNPRCCDKTRGHPRRTAVFLSCEWKAPISPVTRANGTVFVSGLPIPKPARFSQCRSSARPN